MGNPRPLPREGRIIPLDQRPQTASNEDRTRDLVLTRHMLCQLSYRGESETQRTVFRDKTAFAGGRKKRFAPEDRPLGLTFASIAQLAEHVPRKHKVTSSILVGGCLGP